MDVKLTLVLKHKNKDSQPDLALERWVYFGASDCVRSKEHRDAVCQGLLEQFIAERKERRWTVSSSSYELFPENPGPPPA
jgi:hypothetical protein